MARQNRARTAAQRSSSRIAVNILQQHDKWRRVAALLLLEEHGEGHVRVGSAIEHDDVGQSARVGPGEEHEPGLLAEDALERPAAAGLGRHDEDSYHDSATA